MTQAGKDKVLPIDPKQAPPGTITKKALPPYYRMMLTILPIFAGGLAIWAMLNLQIGSDISDIIKACMVGVVVGLVSYGINRTAIDWGTELAASGMVTAGVFSVFSILAVGACLWAFTYAGITLPDTRHLILDDHRHALVEYIDERNVRAAQTTRIVPVIRAVNDDLSYHAECEIRIACVSGRGGGRGPVTRILEEKAARARDITRQVEAGVQALTSTTSTLNELVGKYQTVLNDTDKPISKRRRELIKIDAEVGQAITKLNEAVPVALLSAYADELLSGVNIPNRPQATEAVNRLLDKHGHAIKSVLATLEESDNERPKFPAKAGISSTFDYIGNFIAIAGVIWVAEGIFPLALWLYTFWFLTKLNNQIGQSASVPNGVAPVVTAKSGGRRKVSTPARSKRRSTKTTESKLNGVHHVR